MCSSALSAWNCLKSAANGSQATASQDCARPREKPDPIAEWKLTECRMFTLHFAICIQMVRLQKYLAEAGVASRRAGEQMILTGRVAVNGQTVQALGVKVQPGHDHLTVDGQPVKT